MALKRALVVDDSRSARAALRKLLEEHNLEVAEADSGETALEYLSRDSVDVIFMDHTMPGMDGLEAVSAIKANPETATIPVMMYTTKEGEVYVGQARALGAVGVMPKNVQPHQLFEMLLSLGLVQDRRAETRDEPGSIDLSAIADEVDRELENQALGMSVQALVTRILEDQHLTLRSDILRSQKTFARQVAHEILKEQVLSGEQEVEAAVPDEASSAAGSSNGPLWLAVAAVIAALVCGFLAWQFKLERDNAFKELVAAETTRSAATAAELNDLRYALGSARDRSSDAVQAALAGFSAALAMDGGGDMYADGFSAELAARLQELLPYIDNLGFDGDIVLTHHLGKFCLVVDELGNYQLAPEDALLTECEYMGHVLEEDSYVSDRLSVEFSRLLQQREGKRPALVLQARSLIDSVPKVPYPQQAATAGEWNAAARSNNRVEITFESAK